MSGLKTNAIRATLETLYFSRLHRLAQPITGGVGVILTLHRVRPPRPDAFQPNRHLEISPEFLDQVVLTLIERDIDIVSMDEARHRLIKGGRRFAVLTFDDGYCDTLEYAWPVLKRYNAPFTVYVASAFVDRVGVPWWLALEQAIARKTRVMTGGATPRLLDCSTPEAKAAAFALLHDIFLNHDDQPAMLRGVRQFAEDAGIDVGHLCRSEFMGWRELGQLADEGLATIGAHTVTHPVLARMGSTEARVEMARSASRIWAMLGQRPMHFAYPVGSAEAAGPREFVHARELGFATAVTTRPGVLFSRHRQALTALPRLSVNGQFQRQRYLDVLLSGAATALWNRFRRVNAA